MHLNSFRIITFSAMFLINVKILITFSQNEILYAQFQKVYFFCNSTKILYAKSFSTPCVCSFQQFSYNLIETLLCNTFINIVQINQYVERLILFCTIVALIYLWNKKMGETLTWLYWLKFTKPSFIRHGVYCLYL